MSEPIDTPFDGKIVQLDDGYSMEANEVCLNCDRYPLIILCKTNIIYTAQTDGHGCCQSEAEGFIIQVSSRYRVLDDCKAGCYNLHRPPKRAWEVAKEIDEKLIKLNATPGYNKMRFDFSRIGEFQEGWWPVLYNLYSVYTHPKYVRAILTGWNCD